MRDESPMENQPAAEVLSKPEPIAPDVWRPVMSNGIRDMHERLKVRLGTHVLRAFRTADDRITRGLNDSPADAAVLWHWRRMHFLLIGEFFQNLAVTQKEGGPVFREEENVDDKSGVMVFYFRSSRGPVRVRLILRTVAPIPMLWLGLELLGSNPHKFEQVKIGCDMGSEDLGYDPETDFDHTWPHLHIGSGPSSLTARDQTFASHFFVSPFPLPDEATGIISRDEILEWLPRVQESLRQSLITLEEFVDGMHPFAEQAIMARHVEPAESPHPPGSSRPVVSAPEQETTGAPAARAARSRRYLPPRPRIQRERSVRRVSHVRSVSARWGAFLERARSLGFHLVLAAAAVILIGLVLGSIWNIFREAHRPPETIVTNESYSDGQKSSIASEPPMVSETGSTSPASGTFALLWPVIHTWSGARPADANLMHQVSWMQWDWMHGLDQPLMKHAELSDLATVMKQIDFDGGPLNRGFIGQLTHYVRFRGDINDGTGLAQPGLIGDVKYTGTVENPDFFIRLSDKAKELQAEANRLFDLIQQKLKGSEAEKAQAKADEKIVDDLNARAAVLRTLYREFQIEVAGRYAAIVGQPGGKVGPAMGSQVRLCLRAKYAPQAPLVFFQPGAYMDKYLQFFIADFIESWFQAKKEAYLYRVERHVTVKPLETAKKDLNLSRYFKPYFHERLAYARLQSASDDEIRIQILLNALMPETIAYIENGSQGPAPRELSSEIGEHLPVNRRVAEFIVMELKDGVLRKGRDGYLEINPARKQELLNKINRHEPPPEVGPYVPLMKSPDKTPDKETGQKNIVQGIVLRSDWTMGFSLGMIFGGGWYQIPWLGELGMVFMFAALAVMVFKPRGGRAPAAPPRGGSSRRRFLWQSSGIGMLARRASAAASASENWNRGADWNRLQSFLAGPWKNFILAVEKRKIVGHDGDRIIYDKGTRDAMEKLKKSASQISPGVERVAAAMVDGVSNFLEKPDDPNPQVLVEWMLFRDSYLVPMGHYGLLQVAHNGKNYDYFSPIYRIEAPDGLRQQAVPLSSGPLPIFYLRVEKAFRKISNRKIGFSHSALGEKPVVILLDEVDQEFKLIQGVKKLNSYFGNRSTKGDWEMPMLALHVDGWIRRTFKGMQTQAQEKQFKESLIASLIQKEQVRKELEMKGIRYEGKDHLGTGPTYFRDMGITEEAEFAIERIMAGSLAQIIASSNPGLVLANLARDLVQECQKGSTGVLLSEYLAARYILNRLAGRPLSEWLNGDNGSKVAVLFDKLANTPSDVIKERARQLLNEGFPDLTTLWEPAQKRHSSHLLDQNRTGPLCRAA